MNIKGNISRLRLKLSTPRGRNWLTFMVFLVISALMWLGMSLNEEVQQDLTCKVEIVNCPDTVTAVVLPPGHVSVSVKAKGSQLIRYALGHEPTIKVDYKYYVRGNVLELSAADFRNMARDVLGSNVQIQAMTPDTLRTVYTTRPPVRLPVTVNANITTTINTRLKHPVVAKPDTVSVYSVGPLPQSVTEVTTEPLNVTDLTKSSTVRLRVIPPPMTRCIPDSVDVHIDIERMISRTVKVPVRTVNVPGDLTLLLIPSEVDVTYLVPANNRDKQPAFDVVADFKTLPADFSSSTIKVAFAGGKAPVNACLETDSVEYLIETK